MVEVAQKDVCSTFDVVHGASCDSVQIFRLDSPPVPDLQKWETPEVEHLAEDVCLSEGEIDSFVLRWDRRYPFVP